MDIRDVFARNLRVARTGKGMSQEDLAHFADIDRTYVSALERSRYYASLKTIERIAQVLDVDPAELLKQ